MKLPASTSQNGGFVMGMIVGLLLGLALALGVALYVTKVPIPFVNKVPQRTAEQDAAELEKNKNWDPNSALQGKGGSPASGSAGAAATGAAAGGVTTVVAPATGAADRAPPPSPAATAAAKPATVAPAKPGADPFSYFVQAGAYARTEDAEQQRARLGMLGFEARLTEREQSGRTMYRVRVGPFERRPDAEAARDKLTSAGVDAALVTVQR
ncbi:MAG: SPOR domain-containing protein [Rhizobacter sp.]|nr:SPOR domain-containing protein [Rhizobacter sp.]